MTKDPEISVIIPCYNHGRYVAEAVDSVLAQTYQDFEIIIVDDSSTDGSTPQQIKKMQEKDKRISVYRAPHNLGLPGARNYAIERAQGKYIMPLDADDKFAPTYLEKAIKAMKEHNAGVVYCHFYFFGKISKPQKARISKELPIMPHITASSLYKKADWKKYGGYNNKMRGGFEDWDFWLNFYENGQKFIRIDEHLFYYRIEDNALSTSANKQRKQLIRQLKKNHPKIYSLRHYYLNPQFTRFHLKQMRRFLIQINLKKTKKIIRIMGIYILYQEEHPIL